MEYREIMLRIEVRVSLYLVLSNEYIQEMACQLRSVLVV